MIDRIYNFVFKGIDEMGGVINSMKEVYEMQDKIQKQNQETTAKEKEAAQARKSAAEAAKQAAIAQLQAELGITQGLKTQNGIIEDLTTRIKLLKQARAEATNVADINKYNAALQTSQKELNTLTGVTDKFKGSNGFWREYAGYIQAFFAVQQLYDWGSALVKNEAHLESQRTALRNVISSQTDYAQSLEFLDKLSNKYGQDITILTETYKSFIASSEASGLSLKERNRIYESIIKSGSALKLSNEEIEGSLRAVSQMFSKGNVQAEELRGQLGERLPGAFGLAAKAMGVTEAQLNDLLKEGKVLAVDLLPKLATELEKLYGDKAQSNVNTIAGAYNRASNAVKAWFGGVNESLGITDKFAKGLNFIADNFDDIVKIGGTAIATIIAYVTASKLAAASSAAWALIEKGLLIIRGEAILLTRQQSIANATLTESQLAAAAAAQTFNNTLLKNPIGLIVLAIGTAITAYQVYQSQVEAAEEEQNKLNKAIADGLAPLELERIEFNKLAEEVTKGKLSLQQQTSALEALKKQYPDILKGVTTLTEAEKLLNEKQIKVNSENDYRLGKLNELKAKYPEQLKGINNLKDAEEKLSQVMKDVNADFAVRQKLLEIEIRQNINRERATNLIKEQIELENQLATASRRRVTMVTGTAGNVVTYDSEYEVLQKQIKDKQDATTKLLAQNARYIEDEIDLTKKLKFQYGQRENSIKNHTENTKKEKIDSAKTLALIQEKSDNDAYEKTRITEQKSLALQRDIDKQRVLDSKASATKKAAEILKIEEKFFSDSSQLTNKWDEKEDKEQEKLAAERQKFKEGVDKALLKAEEDKFNKRNKLHIKDAQESKRLDEQINKETEKLTSDKYELLDKMRILDRISHAKNAEEIVKIEKEENQRILENNETFYKRKLTLEQLKLTRIKQTLGEESNEYKAQEVVVLKTQQDLYDAIIKLVEFKTDKVKEGLKDELEEAKKALTYIGNIAGDFFSLVEKGIDQSLSNTTDLVQKARLENQQAAVSFAKDTLGSIASFVSGDIAGGITGAFRAITNGLMEIGQGANRLAQARFEESKKILTDYLETVRKDVDQILESFDLIRENYDGLYEKSTKPQVGTIADLIEKEVQHGQQIIENYNKAVEKVNEWYNAEVNRLTDIFDIREEKQNKAYQDAISKVNAQYDLEIDRINKKYDLINEKANQQYNAETLAIMQQGSVQLEALIKNEESLSSVRAEYAQKRKDIEQIFALANTQLTAESTQAEIDAVNAAIKARDAALSELQGWYNDELAVIIKNEGQKRTEYTETEKIQMQIQDNLNKAALQFQADEIQRAKDKATEIAIAETAKNTAIEQAQIAHNIAMAGIEAERLSALGQLEATHAQYLATLEKDKNDQIAASYQRLRELLVIEADTITRALENSAAKGTEAYRALEAELQRVLDLLDQIGGGGGVTVPTIPPLPTLPPFDPITLPIGFKTGTVSVPGQEGIDKVPAMLTKRERVMPVVENMMLRNFFGKDISNRELAMRAMGVPVMNFGVLDGIKPQPNNSEMIREMKTLNSTLGKLKQINIINKNGRSKIEELSEQRMLKRA